MKKKILLFLLFFILKSIVFGQEIIINPQINSSSITIGEYLEVEFGIEELRTCDDYDIDWEVDYLFNKININVSYDYDEFCEESSETYNESIEHQIVLSGNYDVYINLEVSGLFLSDENIYIGNIDVEPANSGNCFESAPWLDGFCPFNFEEVCACNFITYDNECEAYFNNNIGNYLFENCGSVITSRSKPFFCSQQYSPTESNFFENYNCGNQFTNYSGDEVIIELPNELFSDSLNLDFTSSDNDVKLFLFDLNNLNECLATSIGNKLSYGPIFPFASYFIIADAPSQSNYIFEICNITGLNSAYENIESTKIYPNPSFGQFYIENKYRNIEKLILTDIHGKTIANLNVGNDKISLNLEQIEGLVFAKIYLDNQKVETKKIFFQKAK